MPYNFNSQHEYDVNITDIIRYYKIPNKYKKQIIENFNYVTQRDHDNIIELWNIQGNVKQVFDTFIPLNDFTPTIKEYISFSFNVDKILIFLENSSISTREINVDYLVSNINTSCSLSSNLFTDKPIITSSLYNPSTPSQSINYTIDGNHRVTYCKQNNIEYLSCYHLGYSVFVRFNPFDSYSEYYLYLLFLEIQHYCLSTRFEKLKYHSKYFKICAHSRIQDHFASIQH